MNNSSIPSVTAHQCQFSKLPKCLEFADAMEPLNWLFLTTLRMLSQDEPYVTAEAWKRDLICHISPETKLKWFKGLLSLSGSPISLLFSVTLNSLFQGYQFSLRWATFQSLSNDVATHMTLFSKELPGELDILQSVFENGNEASQNLLQNSWHLKLAPLHILQ